MLPGWCGTGAAAFPGKVNPLLLLHQEGGLGKLLGAAGKAILEISRRLIAVAQTRGPWEPCRVGASTPHPRRAGGPQDQHIGPRGAGTEQKVLQCQHKISKEPCLLQGWLRKSTEDHGPPAAPRAQPRHSRCPPHRVSGWMRWQHTEAGQQRAVPAEADAIDLGPDVTYFMAWAVPLWMLGGGQGMRAQVSVWVWCHLQPRRHWKGCAGGVGADPDALVLPLERGFGSSVRI